MKNNTLLILISVAFLITLGLIFFYVIGFKESSILVTKGPLDTATIKDTLRYEILKSLLQLLLVVIVGGFIAFLFKSREEQVKTEKTNKENEIAKQKDKSEIRIDYFFRLGKIYRIVKEIRRNLVTAGLTHRFNTDLKNLDAETAKIYSKQMNLLNKSQLTLEGLKIESTGIPSLKELPNVKSCLSSMEDYLRQILSEFEKVAPALNKGNYPDYSSLPRLKEFTGSTDDDFTFDESEKKKYRFKANFSSCYKTVIKEIGTNLSVH